MRRRTYILAAAIVAAVGATARAGDVALEVSAREAYVGEPVTVQVLVVNAERHDPPMFPDLPATIVRSEGSATSQNISWVNGRTTRQITVTHTYTIIPKQVGTISIPPIPVRVDGQVLETAATMISVVASDMDDLELVVVELDSNRDSIYLGEAIDLNLEVWVRPYRDRNARLDAQDMLSRVDFASSELGIFQDTVTRFRGMRSGWQYREDIRTDADGTQRSYYVYLLPVAGFVPTRAGPLDVGEINVVVSYPIRTGVERDLFGRPRRDLLTGRPIYTIVKARPVLASLGEPRIEVKPVPAEGQPALFNGAVGQYDFALEASNTDVRVREPIEVTMTITGRGVLERVAPPPLGEIEELTSGFRVPEGSIAGIVESGRKRFTFKIAAKHVDVTEVPAIPFVYFDPQAEEYVTRWSDPVPIEVTASESVPLAEFAETQNGTPTGTTRLTETAVGIRANYADMDEVLAQQAFAPGIGTVVVLAGAPLAFVVCALIRRHSDRLRYDQGYVRRRRAGPTALATIRAASRHANQPQAASQIASAVIRYVADRCNAPAGLTRTEAVEKLVRHGVNAERVRAAQTLLGQCEGLQYAATNAEIRADLSAQAQRCIRELERERF